MVEASAFGDALRQLRLEAGLTQEALAERAGLSPRGLSDLERGTRRTPRASTIRLLADALRRAGTEGERLLPSRHALTHPAGPPRRSNLPAEVSSLVDREREIADLLGLLRQHRVVTLTGPGGVGKTRLAIHLASLVTEEFEDGVRLVDLSALIDDDLVPGTIAAALAEPTEALRAQRLLLVLDNCEQVIGGVAALVSSLARTCPRLSILSTSREYLAIGGEVAWSVQPLAVPPPEMHADAEKVSAYPAVRLFVERAQAVLPRFELTERNAAAVADICRRLDGLPLALELAAARTPVLSVHQIAARLDDRFGLLTCGPRTAPTRHRALWDAIAWSYDLLTEPEQRLLRTLAVFVGGFPLEAVEAVGGPDMPAIQMLGRLVDQSLVTVDHACGATRFGLSESVRAFARSVSRA
jgi:predicted ATPase/DNA-binding XRE family transcriptional regulator